jgi:two-component system, LytTR family, sensor kinase
MFEGFDIHGPVFINTLGHLAGLLLFGLLLCLMRDDGHGGIGRNASSLTAALLAFLWNLGSLTGLGFIQRDGQVPAWLVAINFSFLSLLPAVLFSVISKGRRKVLVGIGYAISFISVVLHFAELLSASARLHEVALLLVTIGFGVLGAITFFVTTGKRDSAQEASLTDLVCLMLLTLSFLHFGYGHSRTAWTTELIWHHAGVPLALIVLLRDYRLLLAEAYVRFVANVGLAGAVVCFLCLVVEWGHLLAAARLNPFVAALLAVALCLAFIGYAYLRSRLQSYLTRRMFRRGDLSYHSQQILQAASECGAEDQFLQRAALEILGFVDAQEFQLLKGEGGAGHIEGAIPAPAMGCAELKLPLRFSRGDSLTLWLGRRRGSRRYLAEDITLLHALTRLTVEQVERLRADRLQNLVQQAELRALRAQINPHFLFNALNTLYGIIERESADARRMVLNLADLFRYSLQQNRTWITLHEELQIVQSYLEIESLRLRERLSFSIEVDPELRHFSIPALSIQPLVENAVKHGISKLRSGGRVLVEAACSENVLRITVTDNGANVPSTSWQENGLGIGLQNVKQRLQLCCGTGSDLIVERTTEGFKATIQIVPRSQPEPQAVAS